MPCSQCFLEKLCSREGGVPSTTEALYGLKTTTRKIGRGGALFRAHDPLTAIYVVRHGAFKSVAVSREGHHKVTGFHLPGETMGLEAISEGRHFCTAIALEDSEVCAASYAQLERLASRVLPVYLSLLCALSSEAWRNQGLLLMADSLTAEQRVEGFLLSLSRRYGAHGGDIDRLHLPMSRVDVGSYLGLAHETVSRVFTRLSHDGLLRVHDRDVRLLDVERVEDIVGNHQQTASRSTDRNATLVDVRHHAKTQCEENVF